MKIIRNYPIVLLIAALLLLTSCSQGDDTDMDQLETVQVYRDHFDYLKPFWDTTETQKGGSYEIVPVPGNPNNYALHMYLFPGEEIQNGKRNELKLSTKDSLGYTIHYSFRFMFPETFFKSREERSWVIFHQWHDRPPKGVSWSDYHRQTHPPIAVYIQMLPDHKNRIVYVYGLWDKDMNHKQTYTYSEFLKPGVWYTFENTVYWSLTGAGYSIPKINGRYLVAESEDKAHKVHGANQFNPVPNYYKMGLYGNYKRADTIAVYFDDFNYTLRSN